MTGSSVGTAVRSAIKSIQYGTINLNSLTTQTATVTAVVVAKSVLQKLGAKTNSGTANPSDDMSSITLTNTTTVTATRGAAIADNNTVSFVLTEYN